jgi:signal transduction histidine kinase
MRFSTSQIRAGLVQLTIAAACAVGGVMAWWGVAAYWTSTEKSLIQHQLVNLTAQLEDQLIDLESLAVAETGPNLSDPIYLKSLSALFKQDFPFIRSIQVLDRDGNSISGNGLKNLDQSVPSGPGFITLLESALKTNRPIYSSVLELNPENPGNGTVILVSPARRKDELSMVLTLSLYDLIKITTDKLHLDPQTTGSYFHLIAKRENSTERATNQDWLQINKSIDHLGLEISLQGARSRALAPGFTGIRYSFTLIGGLAGLFLGLWLRGISLRRINRQKLQALESKLEAESKIATLGEMSTAIAHELNQPLGAIENFAFACEKILGQHTGAPAQVLEGLAQIRHEASRSAAVIRSIRSFVKREDSAPESVKIDALMAELMPLMLIQAKAHQCKLRLDCDSTAEVICDRSLLQQVVLNLAKNAFEAMTDSPIAKRELLIVVKKIVTDRRIRFIFDDNGCGVSSENSAQLFRPFFSTKTNGLGVGLSLSLSIAERNGGSITWRNKSSGGAEFILELPSKN